MAFDGQRVLYISYNGMLDPLGQSQVIPYVRELTRAGLQFSILSFEREEAFSRTGLERCTNLKQSLNHAGIEWQWLKYHQRPSLPATMFDVVNGIRKARTIVRGRKFELIHARGYIPAAIALGLKRFMEGRFIFDIRGLMADEYVDAGHWKKGSLAFRLTKKLERSALTGADGIVTLTTRIWPIIREWDGLRGREVVHEVIPCCADLTKFRFDEEQRRSTRNSFKLENKYVIAYSGSIGGWYLNAEMADFFAVLLDSRPDAHALWLTPSGHETVKELMTARGIATERYTITASLPESVSSYLSAADAGLAFIKPCFSKLASSPTKTAEYLACGLPIIINSGIGDSDRLVAEERAGELVTSFGRDNYLAAVNGLKNRFADAVLTRKHCRSIAERCFDVAVTGLAGYARLYEKVLASGSSQAQGLK